MLALTLAAASVSGPSVACSFAPPTCVSEINGRESERVDTLSESPDVSIFVEWAEDNESLATLYLVDCRTRRGVRADLPDGADFGTPGVNASVDYLVEAASSERTYSLGEVRQFLLAEGLSARVSKLPAGHCGCDLPPMEVTACPGEIPLLKQ